MKSKHKYTASLQRKVATFLAASLILTGVIPSANAVTYDVGSSWVGMSAEATSTLTGTSTAYKAVLSGNVTVKLLKIINRKAAEGELSASVENTGKGRVVGYLKLMGKTVGKVDETLVTAKKIKTPSVVAGISLPRLKFNIGPVSLGVRFWGNVSAWSEASAAITSNGNTALPPIVKITAGPQAEAVAGGDVDLSLVVVKGGVSGQCRVAKHAINGILLIDFAQKKGTADVVWSRWDPNGSIEGYVKVRLIFWNKTYRKTLVSWDGSQKDVKLVSRNFTLTYRKPPTSAKAAPLL